MSEATEIVLPTGRLVGGHPMIRRPKTDRKTGAALLQKDGVTPRTNVFLAVAIMKQGETDWKQTAWGQKIQQVAQRDWPHGQWQAGDFAWKVEDGDSALPKKGGAAANNTREGHPGHWIVKASTELNAPRCYHDGRFQPYEQIQDESAIKPGDYIQLVVTVLGNGPVSESPGLYINPVLVNLVRAGQRIILDSGPDAAAVFGAAPAQLPPGALIDNTVAATPPPPPAAAAAAATPPPPPPAAASVQPAADFLNPPPPPPPVVEEKFLYNGAVYTRAQLVGWNDEQINALPRA